MATAASQERESNSIVENPDRNCVGGPTTATNPQQSPLDISGIPESSNRRFLELRLLHNFTIQTSATFPFTHDPSTRTLWADSVPSLALSHPSLLYALLSISALHLLKVKQQDIRLRDAHPAYLRLAAQSHRQGVNYIDAENVDVACFTSVLIIINLYAGLQDREIELSYNPPMQWLRVSNGLRNMFHTLGMQPLQDNPGAAVNALIKSASSLSDPHALLKGGSLPEFSSLLRGRISHERYDGLNGTEGINEEHEDLDDPETQEAYNITVAYIGTIYLAIKAGEHEMEICRRLVAFAVLIPNKMIASIEEKRPRALVILAHYFALSGQLTKMWWIGNGPQQEVSKIQQYLPQEWQGLMRWPLQMSNIT
ncbi:hypothetical protein ACLMJK_002222 [Lecanora helva]